MDALFDGPEPLPSTAKESAGVSRTRRQRELLAVGCHPLTLVLSRPLPLHSEAAPHDDLTAPGRRCGTCVHLTRNGWGYLKCGIGDGVRTSHGEGTDARRWWPACRDHEPREELPRA